MLRNLLFAAVLLATLLGTARADGPFPAHRVAGNTYYVGSRELASYLITSADGHFLINSSFEETVPLIRGAVESLGFKMSDVKYLLASHAHSDHVAGHAKMRELTGAKVLVMEGDQRVVASGGVGQYLYTDSRWPECPVDRVLKDGEEITLGGVTLVARRTPGHTRGCTTWTWRETVEGKPLSVVVIGSPNVNPGYRLVGNTAYPEIADDFAKTFRVLRELPCDVFLGAHGNYYDMLAKHERLEKKEPGNPFVDPTGYKTYVSQKEATFRSKLAGEQAGPVDQKAAAEQLRKAGAEVTLTKNVITGVAVKDLARFTDQDFQTLGRLAHLKTLSTSGEALDDRTLAFLAPLAGLEDLSTNAAQITDEGLALLANLKGLKQIKFFHTSLRREDFTGKGLAQLASLPNLRRLTVAGCPFNDEGMAAVGKLTQLESFRTWHTYQTEAGNESLKRLTNLKSLHLGQRLRRYGGASNAHSLTDRTLDIVADLVSLETLTLAEQKFSVEALAKLKSLPKLKQLDLTQVDITETDVERVRAALPRVKVSWRPMSAEERTKLDRLLAP
jgi:metallo-beta-lactamase class B